MKKIFILSMLMICKIACADNQEETLYHCPTLNEIKYQNGTFRSSTTYNGVTINWMTAQNFPEKDVQVVKFNFTHTLNNCSGGLCSPYCVYDTNSKAVILKLYQNGDIYKVSSTVGTNWEDGWCESSYPEDCLFNIVKKTYAVLIRDR